MRANYSERLTKYFKTHQVSLGVFLASYGVFYLSSVLLSLWTTADWGKDIVAYPQTYFNPILPRSFIAPIFFVTSLPSLIIGAAILCANTLQGMKHKPDQTIKYTAILLTVFGFAYQVIGAWPLQNKVDLPWQWQKQIVADGSVFAWGLYFLSLITLAVGAFSLYKFSIINNRKLVSGENG